ncbi:unnamed protein product, partial [Staurois parvus]
SRDTCDLLRLDTPNKSFLPTLDASPCRHSPRLLSNGYYMFEDDSYNTDDEGNLSFSPTKCTISYKENVVRIFRRRRRPHAQRALDLSNHENQEGWRPQLEEDLCDCEPLDFIQTFNNFAERITNCTSRSTIGSCLAASVSQVLQSEQSNLQELQTSEPFQDNGSLSSIFNSESRTFDPSNKLSKYSRSGRNIREKLCVQLYGRTPMCLTKVTTHFQMTQRTSYQHSRRQFL